MAQVWLIKQVDGIAVIRITRFLSGLIATLTAKNGAGVQKA
jgi:hypothetical protein